MASTPLKAARRPAPGPAGGLDEPPVWIDRVDGHGRIVQASPLQQRLLGYPDGALDGAAAAAVYEADALAFIEGARLRGGVRQALLTMRRADGSTVRVAATADIVDDARCGACVRLTKQPLDELLPDLASTRRDNEVLSSIVAQARDATYCIEFLEPVDLSAPEHEIVRQVFENPCVWRYCNEAMGALYRLPLGDDLNRRRVGEVFPRNADNEAFVRELLASGFHVDGVLSRDHRYDGRDVTMENDVRGEVRFGRLFRFWGIVRDVSARGVRERELMQQVDVAMDVLGALPDPVLVIDASGRIVGANPALEWKTGWSVDAVLGTSIDGVLQTGMAPAQLAGGARPADAAVPRTAEALCRDGRRLPCEAVIASIAGDAPSARCAIALRFAR